jgi:hypothetical protein
VWYSFDGEYLGYSRWDDERLIDDRMVWNNNHYTLTNKSPVNRKALRLKDRAERLEKWAAKL